MQWLKKLELSRSRLNKEKNGGCLRPNVRLVDYVECFSFTVKLHAFSLGF